MLELPERELQESGALDKPDWGYLLLYREVQVQFSWGEREPSCTNYCRSRQHSHRYQIQMSTKQYGFFPCSVFVYDLCLHLSNQQVGVTLQVEVTNCTKKATR